MEENEEEIEEIRRKIESRNPLAFEAKLKVVDKTTSKIHGDNYILSPEKKVHHAKGWNWKKSQCSNNYWECHQLGAKWTDLWAWIEWKN